MWIKIDPSTLKMGDTFSSPIFFDDKQNMFLAFDKTIKSYHLAAIKRWNIKELYLEELDELEEV